MFYISSNKKRALSIIRFIFLLQQRCQLEEIGISLYRQSNNIGYINRIQALNNSKERLLGLRRKAWIAK